MDIMAHSQGCCGLHLPCLPKQVWMQTRMPSGRAAGSSSPRASCRACQMYHQTVFALHTV